MGEVVESTDGYFDVLVNTILIARFISRADANIYVAALIGTGHIKGAVLASGMMI